MVPFYFGASDKPLFGCYHEPPPGSRRDCAVALCNALGYEYISSHRALRQLATRLADVGFPVLRFDYYGCGDSTGADENGGIRQWLNDVSAAIVEVRKRSGCGKVCLVGVRLGGTLSVLIGAERRDLEALVLWDPVCNGKAYIQELIGLHQQMTHAPRPTLRWFAKNGGRIEALGYPLTKELLGDLKKVDLLSIHEKPANRVLMIESEGDTDYDPLTNHFRTKGIAVDYQRLPAPRVWLQEDALGTPLVPVATLRFVVSWLLKVCS